MKNYIETLEFKLKWAQHHYNQAMEASKDLNKDNVHICISEFCAMMEVLWSCIQIAGECANKQSTVDAKTFEESINEQDKDELLYIMQFLKANQSKNVFGISDTTNVKILPISKRNKRDTYCKRELIPYINEVKTLAEDIINKYLKIYTESSSHYNQSWRNVEMNRASFTCKECGWTVTKLLKHIGNLNSISLKSKEPYISSWDYVYGHEVIHAKLLPWGGVNEITEDEVIIPIDSLYFDVKKEPSIGCCGPDSSEYNVYCKNGHPVGKEAADCWMPHFIRLSLNRIKRHETV